jgi:hypothetical protein
VSLVNKMALEHGCGMGLSIAKSAR